jgi:hypothetical protein
MNTKELNALKERAHKTAVEHGFHEKEMTDAYYLGLVMSDMGKAINADRKGWRGDAVLFDDDEKDGVPFAENFKKHIKDSVEDELADIIIRLLDFAGMKGYKLLISGYSARPSNAIIETFAENGLSGTLFHLNGALSDSLDDNSLESCVRIVINIISDCFDEITGGSDCDLWWFVKKKMQYNDLRPMLNGKKY